MKKKHIDGSDIDSDLLLEYSTKLIRLKEGVMSCIHIKRVGYKVFVDYDDSKTCLIDDDYHCLIYLPYDSKWCMSLFMNESFEIIEWYFDITYFNDAHRESPYFIDLYLDIAVSNDGIVAVLDEDELLNALTEGVITEEDVKMAKKTCLYLMENVITDKEWMLSWKTKYLKCGWQ